LKVYAFIGPSGTGKSHNAGWVANERHIDYIIDDGLLVKGSSIIAGASAKRESTRIASVKRAIFNDPAQAAIVTKAIAEEKPESVLVLGTSDEMVDLICNNLKLPPISARIYINEVVTEEDIKTAMYARKEKGKHVIPVPAMEIKKQFSGYFLDPLNIFHKKDWHRYRSTGERSVVRPTFSYMGNFEISDSAIRQIVDHVVLNTEGVHKIIHCIVDSTRDGKTMDLALSLNFGYPIFPILKNIQRSVIKEIEKSTGINIIRLNVTAKTINY
jgi:uncharacterized alkaline shock family protein YloU